MAPEIVSYDEISPLEAEILEALTDRTTVTRTIDPDCYWDYLRVAMKHDLRYDWNPITSVFKYHGLRAS